MPESAVLLKNQRSDAPAEFQCAAAIGRGVLGLNLVGDALREAFDLKAGSE